MRNRSNRNQSGYFALVVDWLWLVASRKGCINRQISTNQLTHTHIHWTKNCHPMWHAYKGNTNQAFVILVEDTTASHGPIRKAISSATTLPKIGVQSFNLWPQPQIPYANMADQSYANEWKLRSRRLPAPDRHWLRTNKQKKSVSASSIEIIIRCMFCFKKEWNVLVPLNKRRLADEWHEMHCVYVLTYETARTSLQSIITNIKRIWLSCFQYKIVGNSFILFYWID